MKRGAALPAVLLALTLTSAMAIGSAFVARRHASMARDAGRSAALLPSAERAAVEAITGWDSAARASQPVGTAFDVGTTSGPVGQDRVWVTRLAPSLFWVVSEATTASKPVLRRRIGVVVLLVGGVPRVAGTRAAAELP